MVELKEITGKILELFECTIDELPTKIMEKVQSKDIKKTVKEYEKIVKEDPDTDWLQAVYQRNLADREEKSQDFTPKTLSKLCAEITRHNEEIKYLAELRDKLIPLLMTGKLSVEGITI